MKDWNEELEDFDPISMGILPSDGIGMFSEEEMKALTEWTSRPAYVWLNEDTGGTETPPM